MEVTPLLEGNGTLPTPLQGEPNLTVTPTPFNNETHQRYLRELALQEFYSTYDVWTGIRTAVTLSLFFVFTVTLILYKSKCKPRRKYELYPSLEDMPGRPLDYCDYWCSSPGSHDAGQKASQVDSLGRCYNHRGETGSAPLPTQRSVGSYSSLNNSFRVKSLSGSVMRINCSRNSSFERDDTSQATGHSVRSEFLSVPGVRLQSTGSSSDGYSAGSSLHDLTGEMTPMALLGVPGLGPRDNKPLLQLGGMDWGSDHATAEWIQTIDINVIQPTPNISPCGSVRSVSDNSELARLPLPGRNRAASLGSLDSPELDCRSIGSDSVFVEDSFAGETMSSRSESVDSGSTSQATTPRAMLTPSPCTARRKVQSFRLGINPSASTSASPQPPSSPVPSRALAPDASPRPRDQRNRQKLLKQQKVQEEPPGGISNGLGRNDNRMQSLAVPFLGGHLRGSCERLAAHTALKADSSERGSSRSSGLLVPSGSGSTEEEPMCAVFTVPSLRRCNSATTPGQVEEAEGWKRSDSEQNPVVRRSDSASSRQRQSSESSSGSDDASESVSFHLMVPGLSLDQPSADTSRASSPALSPPSSPNCTPPSARRAAQSPHPMQSPYTPSSTPSPTRGRGGRNNVLGSGLTTGRGNGLLGSDLNNGFSSNGSLNGRPVVRNGRRVLRRQYSQCAPPSPTLRDVPTLPVSLPTYVEDDLEIDWTFPPAPPPSPFKAGQALYFRQDTEPPSPHLAAHHFNRQESTPSPIAPPSPFQTPHHFNRQQSTPSPIGPPSPLLVPHHLNRQESSPSPIAPPSPLMASHHLNRQESSPGPMSPRSAGYHLLRQEFSPTSPCMRREDSSPTPPYSKPSLNREDSSPITFSFPSDAKDDSRHSSTSSSVMETPC